jgi:hypothetical protein
VFRPLFTFILQQHNLFETEAPLFSTQVRKSVVTDAFGQKIKHCENCKQTPLNLLSCAKCLSVRYCSKQCQTSHWPEHKPFCLAVRSEAGLAVDVPKHLSVDTESVVHFEQVDELFKHTCFRCCGWANNIANWDSQAVFCSRACRRRDQ